MKRLLLLAPIALAIALGVVATAPAAKHKKPARPNIVFVLTDDLSKNLVPYMPHVQAMQRAGVSFSNYFVTDSLCCPSRSTIFSGRFPHNTKVFTNKGPDGGYHVFHNRGEEKSTFGTALQKAGYRTAMMGKYLNGYVARSAPRSPTGPVPPGWNEWDVADNGYAEYNYDMNVNGTVVHHRATPADYLTTVVQNAGINFINRSADARKPFILEIATFAPHQPATPAPRDVGTFRNLQLPREPAFNAKNLNPPAWLGPRNPLTAPQIRRLTTLYRKRVRSVQAVDRMLGRLQATLRARGILKNTYIVFSSDNGFHLGQHRLLQGKQTAFDHDINVPLVITGPGVKHRTVGAFTQNTDLRPTFSRLGGAAVPASVDGRSLTGLIAGHRTPRDWRVGALIEHHGPTSAPDPDAQTRLSGNPTTYEALRGKGFVWVEYTTGEREYYDLKKDPYELVNVAGRLSKKRKAALHRRLAALERCQGTRSCLKAGR